MLKVKSLGTPALDNYDGHLFSIFRYYMKSFFLLAKVAVDNFCKQASKLTRWEANLLHLFVLHCALFRLLSLSLSSLNRDETVAGKVAAE